MNLQKNMDCSFFTAYNERRGLVGRFCAIREFRPSYTIYIFKKGGP